jgi:hypothetical protein
LSDAIDYFVATDLQPLSVVESHAFWQIIQKAEPRFMMPSQKQLSTQLIPKCFTDIFSKTVALKKCAPQICITLDIWTNRQMRSYLGMTANFITEFHLMSAMIACRRFHGSHTGEDILEHFLEIEKEFVISGKVENIITDDGSNMLKAFGLLNLEEDSDDPTDCDDEELQPVEVLCRELDIIKPNHYSSFSHTL